MLTFWLIWFFKLFPLLYICLHCDEGCICWHFGGPGAPGFYVRAQHIWTKMGPVWLLKPPPPPRPPNSEICFPHMKNVLSIFIFGTYVSSVMRYCSHFTTSAFNIWFPIKKLIANFHQITAIFSKFSWGLQA